MDRPDLTSPQIPADTQLREKLKPLLARWSTEEGKPIKGTLINMTAHAEDPDNLNCMCAQGQLLHVIGGISPNGLSRMRQLYADLHTAKILNISLTHAALLRTVNDMKDSDPSRVISNPEVVLGDQAAKLLAFWSHLDSMTDLQWTDTETAHKLNITDASKAAFRDAIYSKTWSTAQKIAWHTGWTTNIAVEFPTRRARAITAQTNHEIMIAQSLRARDQALLYLPLFGFETPDDIPPLRADYGVKL